MGRGCVKTTKQFKLSEVTRITAWMGATHFLTRTLRKVRTEKSLQVLAYNLKRMMALLGVGPLIEAMAA